MNLKALPEAIEEVVNVQEKWPLIIDTADLASRFLRYQRGPFLYFERPTDMQPESLRYVHFARSTTPTHTLLK